MSELASKLFQPIHVGDVTLAHRVVMAPMTRMRASVDHVPQDVMVTYYDQRSKVLPLRGSIMWLAWSYSKSPYPLGSWHADNK